MISAAPLPQFARARSSRDPHSGPLVANRPARGCARRRRRDVHQATVVCPRLPRWCALPP
ncbi:hypothetical protein ACFPRL_01705 [Pseudoclavibacter helvolus]